MDEIWERAVEAALDGQTDRLATRTLTLDGAVKCVQGRLPPPSLLERFQNLHHLSIANIGVSSLEQFPRLGNLQKLILSDNRITVGLDFLVEAGLDSLRDLDLSNNRIQFIEDLAPLAELKLVSLDLYECPVTRVKDYRSRVFALIKTLKYLDKTDAEGNERPESDDEDDEEDDEEDEEDDEEGDEEDPGSGEVDGDERAEAPWISNGHSERPDGVVDLDEDEESDAEDDESEQANGVNGPNYRPNGFCLQAVNGEDDGDDSESGEEIDEEEIGEEDTDVVEVHEIEDSDNEEDGVDDEEDDEDDENEEEVDNDDRGLGVPGSTGRLMNAGEIDGHEQGDDDEDGDGETGEDDQGVEDDGDFVEEDDDVEAEDEESGEGYLVQPVSQVEDNDAVGSDIEPINEDNDPDEEEEEEVEDDLPVRDQSLPSSSHPKRKRDEYDDEEDDDDDDDGDDDDDDDGVDDEEG